MDVNRAEDKHLIRGRRIQDLRDWFSVEDFADLIVFQADKLVEELVRFGWIVCCENTGSTNRCEKQGEQYYCRDSSVHEPILRCLVSKAESPLSVPLLILLRAGSFHCVLALRPKA